MKQKQKGKRMINSRYKPLTVHFEGIRTNRKAEFKELFNM